MRAYSPDVQDLTPQADTTAEVATLGPPFRRQSANGAEQERRKQWGKVYGARVSAAVSEAIKGA